jgi:ankyrin repeat protein
MARHSVAVILAMALVALSSARAELPETVKRSLAGRDFESAVEWLAAHPDDPDAAFELGKLYRLGKGGLPKDADRAAALFESAAEGGHVEAQYVLAKQLERQGQTELAARWMRTAAAAGHPRAAAWLEAKPDRIAPGDPFASLRRHAPPGNVEDSQLGARDDGGRTLLMAAAEAGATDWLDYLIDRGADLDAVDPRGATALHGALAAGQSEAAMRLIDAGANPNVAAQGGTTPLHQAVAADAVGLTRGLLAAGAKPDILNDAGWSPAMLAKRSDSGALRKLFGASTRDRSAPVGSQTLAEAARRGDAKRMAELMATGARLDATDPAASVLVELAIKRDDAAVLESLLQAGAAADGSDREGRTPLQIAAENGCDACVAVLIERGADLTRADGKGQTPLIVAARQGQLDIVRRLLEAGAEARPTDRRGRDALWWACRNGHTRVAVTLLEGVRDVRADAESVGPLHTAAENNDVALVRQLVAVAPLDAQSAAGSTPLMLAAHAGSTDVASVLIAAGADLEIRNRSGDTALIMAARAGHLSTTELLLRAGANPRTRNDEFQSAATIIEQHGEPEWQALLELTDKGLLGVLGAR